MVIKFEGTFADILGDMYDFLHHITDPVEHAAPAPAPEPAPAAPAPAPAAQPEKVDLPALRTLTKDWLRASSAHTKELRGWLDQQGLSRVSDISKAAQADSLKQLIKGA